MRYKIWWHLLRGGNLMMMVVALLLIWWVTAGALPTVLWLGMTTGTVVIAGAGNLLNDLYDCEMDALNKPDRVWIGTVVSPVTAWQVYLALQCGVLGIALWVGSWQLASIFILESIVLYAYSKYWKCRPLIGNLVVAALCGVLVLQYWGLAYTALTPHWRGWLVSYAGFAFGSNWMREWVKDLEDHSGDAAVGCQTLAVQWSWANNRRGLLVVWSIWCVGLLWAGQEGDLLGLCQMRHVYGGIMVAGTVYLGHCLWHMKTAEHASQISQFLKGYMALGLGGLLWG